MCYYYINALDTNILNVASPLFQPPTTHPTTTHHHPNTCCRPPAVMPWPKDATHTWTLTLHQAVYTKYK